MCHYKCKDCVALTYTDLKNFKIIEVIWLWELKSYKICSIYNPALMKKFYKQNCTEHGPCNLPVYVRVKPLKSPQAT